MNRRILATLVAAYMGLSATYSVAHNSTMPDSDKAFQSYMDKMQTHMSTMQAQMQKIQQTTDPAERQRLLQEHWDAMQEGMRLMHSTEDRPGCLAGYNSQPGKGPGMGRGNAMGNPPMMGSGPMNNGGHMMGGEHMMNGSHMMDGSHPRGHGAMMGSWWHNDDRTGPDPDRRLQMMDSCMGVQQQMMDQMMQRMGPASPNQTPDQ